MLATKILIKPIVTEKSYKLLKQEVYLFVVHPKADKPMVKNAFETVFGVKVANVNLSIRKRKPKSLGRFHGFKKAIKKAYIKIKPGQNFTFLKGTDEQLPSDGKTASPKGWSLFNRFSKQTTVKPNTQPLKPENPKNGS